QTRRKKCNIIHLEPLDKVLKIKKGASHEEVREALKHEGIEVLEKAIKEAKAPKKKEAAATEEKPKKAAKKAADKTEKPKAEDSVEEKPKKTVKKAVKKDN
ncbi:MAG: hypothetical protein HGA85_08785, partial [Nanoarchaeota archaeon]|nr:hypothetical protein [Nanoarchaeota archaeon]